MAMKLFIWEGNGISGAWHDDGTLVVLAETAEQAREFVKNKLDEKDKWDNDNEHNESRTIWYQQGEKRWLEDQNLWYGKDLWESDKGKELHRIRESFEYPGRELLPDGDRSAIDREPDRIVEITDNPALVAFNGGGYD